MAKRPLYWVRCCVPGCNKAALQREQGRPVSVFRVPRNAVAREAWEQRLELAPGTLRQNSQLCELHFDPSQICRDYVHLIDGKEVRIPRGRATLLPDTLPLAPEKLAEGDEGPDLKRLRSEENLVPIDENVDRLSALRLPSKYWSCVHCPNMEGVVFATSTFSPATADLVTEKMVVVQWADNEKQEAVVYDTILRGRRLGDAIVGDLDSVQRTLCAVDAMQLCNGVGGVGYVLEQLGGRLTAHLERSLVLHGETYFSQTCTATVETAGASCAPCKHARKAVLTKKSALLRKNFLVTYVDNCGDGE